MRPGNPTKPAMLVASLAVALWATRLPGAATEPDQGTSGTANSYSFTLDGEPYSPEHFSLTGDSEIRAGDVLVIYPWAIVAPEAGAYRFERSERDDELWNLNADGTTSVLAVSVGDRYEGNLRFDDDPTTRLAREQLQALRGVTLEKMSSETLERLRGIDPARCCVSVRDSSINESVRFSFPMQLQYLIIEERSYPAQRDYQPLREQSALRFFRLESLTPGAFDAAILRNWLNLEHLHVVGTRSFRLADQESLAALKELRVLSLESVAGLEDPQFLARLPRLRRLDLTRSDVKDLRPVSSLSQLEEIRAIGTLLKHLPDAHMEALRRLQVVSTPLGRRSLSQFREKNPSCVVQHDWNDALQQELTGITRVVLRTGGSCHRRPDEKILAVETDSRAIAELIGSLKVHESGMSCMCCGSPSFEFYREDQLVVTLSMQHGAALRWNGVWPHDGTLTYTSGKRLAEWLVSHGVKGAREEWKENHMDTLVMTLLSSGLGAGILAALVLIASLSIGVLVVKLWKRIANR